MFVINLMSYSYDIICENNSLQKKTYNFSSIIVTLMDASIETNTCMTLINYILILVKSEPSADKAIHSSLYTMSRPLYKSIILFLIKVLKF